MKSFVSLVSNGEYSIGCTGQTVCVFDKNGAEIAKFKDLPYAYDCAISPKGDVFVVKTTEGRLAVYSLDGMRLVKKFRFSTVDEMQDDNFCFSPDGEELYNIERHTDGCKTALSVYDTKDFSLKKRLFSDNTDMMLSCVEINGGEIYLLGFFRKSKTGIFGKKQIGAAEKFFVAKLVGDEICNIRYISENDYRFCADYKKAEFSGFTEESKRLSGLSEEKLIDAYSCGFSIAQVWENA